MVNGLDYLKPMFDCNLIFSYQYTCLIFDSLLFIIGSVNCSSVYDKNESNPNILGMKSNHDYHKYVTVCQSTSILAINSDIVALSLPSEKATEDAIFSADGLISGFMSAKRIKSSNDGLAGMIYF